MSDIFAAKNGNFDDVATWTGGVIPGPADRAIANDFSITIQVDATVTSFHTDGAAYGGADGGKFTINVCTATGDAYAGSSLCMSAGKIGAIFNGDAYGGFSSLAYGIALQFGGVQNGDSYAGTLSGVHGAQIQKGGLQNGNSFGGAVSGAHGALVWFGGMKNGDSTGGSVDGSYGTYATSAGLQNGNNFGGTVSGAYGAMFQSGSIHNGDNTSGAVSGAHGVVVQTGSVSAGNTSTSLAAGAYGTKYESNSKGVFINKVGADAVHYSSGTDESLDKVINIGNPFIVKPEVRKLNLVEVKCG